jgi:hypothetical protein
MPRETGSLERVSLLRQVVCDFLHFSQQIPTVTIGRTMDLREVAAARQAAQPRPSWCGLFTRAYALVVARRPDLQRLYVDWPWPRFYTHHESLGAIVVEASVHGEDVVLPCILPTPERWDLLTIDRHVARAKADPLGQVKQFRRGLLLARLPRFLRRLLWSYSLNWSGHRRARCFGTFGVTTVAGLGADSLRPLSPWTTLLHPGVLDAAGSVVMRLTYDHRVLDGRGPALALAEMEEVLRTEMLDELARLASRAA